MISVRIRLLRAKAKRHGDETEKRNAANNNNLGEKTMHILGKLGSNNISFSKRGA